MEYVDKAETWSKRAHPAAASTSPNEFPRIYYRNLLVNISFHFAFWSCGGSGGATATGAQRFYFVCSKWRCEIKRWNVEQMEQKTKRCEKESEEKRDSFKDLNRVRMERVLLVEYIGTIAIHSMHTGIKRRKTTTATYKVTDLRDRKCLDARRLLFRECETRPRTKWLKRRRRWTQS